MSSFFSHVRTSFGRRLLLLFILCVAIPGTVLGYFSLRKVEENLLQETKRRMRVQSREIVMVIHGEFSSIERDVEFLSGLLGEGVMPISRQSSDWRWMFQNRPLLGATRILDGSRTEPFFGNPGPPPPQTGDWLGHLASGKGLLYIQKNPGGSPRIFLAHAIQGKDPGKELMVCEVNPEYLWRQVQNAAPPVSDVAVIAPDGTPLYQTQPFPAAVLGRARPVQGAEPAGTFEWGEGAESRLVDHSTVFLRPAFFSDDWNVVVSQSRSESLSAANQFTRTYSLSIFLVLLVSGLFAHVQIRRGVAPLAKLKEGTMRISGGDFGNRVEIRSGDEFEDLAGSFNAMAGHLGRQFQIHSDMGRIVHGIQRTEFQIIHGYAVIARKLNRVGAVKI